MADMPNGATPNEPSTVGATQATSQQQPLVEQTSFNGVPEPQQPQVPELTPEQRLIREQQSLLDQYKSQLTQFKYQQFAQPQNPQPQVQQTFNDPQPDPQQDPAGWWDWKLRQDRAEILKGVREEFNGLISKANSATWSQQHGGIDVNVVDGYASYKFGIGAQSITPQLREIAYQMMQYESGNQVQQPQNNQVPSFQQTPQSITPTALLLRGGQPPQTVQPQTITYDQLEQEFIQSNGKAQEKWTPEMRTFFAKGTALRNEARSRR